MLHHPLAELTRPDAVSVCLALLCQAHSSLHPDEGVAAPGHQRQRTSRASETPVLSDTAAHLQGEVTPLLGGDGHHHHHHHHYSIDKEQGGGPADRGNSPSASSTTAPPHA